MHQREECFERGSATFSPYDLLLKIRTLFLVFESESLVCKDKTWRHAQWVSTLESTMPQKFFSTRKQVPLFSVSSFQTNCEIPCYFDLLNTWKMSATSPPTWWSLFSVCSVSPSLLCFGYSVHTEGLQCTKKYVLFIDLWQVLMISYAFKDKSYQTRLTLVRESIW